MSCHVRELLRVLSNVLGVAHSVMRAPCLGVGSTVHISCGASEAIHTISTSTSTNPRIDLACMGTLLVRCWQIYVVGIHWYVDNHGAP
jgi:hypothetical protein